MSEAKPTQPILQRLSVLLLLFVPFFSSYSQTPDEMAAFDRAFTQETLTQNAPQQEYFHPEDEVSFAQIQQSSAAEAFVTRQAEMIDQALQLGELLEVENQKNIRILGEARVLELREVLSDLGKSAHDLRRRMAKLEKLGFREEDGFADLVTPEELMVENVSEATIRKVGEWVFYDRVMRGLKINELEIKIPGLGRAEPSNIAGQVVSRVVHEETGILYLIVNDRLILDTVHFKRYLARLRTLSDKGKGRPVVVLSHEQKDVNFKISNDRKKLSYQFYDRPKTRTEKRKAWWDAHYVPPDKESARMAIISTVFEVALTEVIAGAQYHLGNTAGWDHGPALLSGMFSTVFGLWGSFYYNITKPVDNLDKASRGRALVKKILISSASFAYSLQIMRHGWTSLMVYTTGDWLKDIARFGNSHGRLWGNIVLNALVKDNWRQMSDVSEEMGKSRGKVPIWILGGDVKKNHLSRNAIDQIPRALKKMDLMKLNVGSMPVGLFLFYSSYFWSKFILVKYAEASGYERQHILREQWDKMTMKVFGGGWIDDLVGSVYMGLKPTIDVGLTSPKVLLSAMASVVSDVAESGWDKAKWLGSQCRRLLSKSSQVEVKEASREVPFFPTKKGEWVEVHP